MQTRSIRAWYLVHKWTSLICTAFLLMLCVTGLPLIFHEELEDLLGHNAPLAEVPAGTPAPSLDAVVAAALAARPGEVAVSMYFEPDRPVATVTTAQRTDAPFDQMFTQPVDLRTGALLPPPPQDEGFLHVMRELHVSMFADLPGTLFLGAMGVLFVAALVSGVVVYAPFMRRLDFGTVRTTRSARLKWLDLHNLLGVATMAWLLLVGLTGIFNTLDRPLAMQWRAGQLADMTAAHRGAPPARSLSSLDAAAATAEAAAPGMIRSIVSFPGSYFTTPSHYNIFLRGASPVTERLIQPALIDAESGRLIDTQPMPLHIRALFLSRPLHFGDYGGMPLKLVWAALDLLTIAILGSGLYLWLGRRRTSLDRRVAELTAGGLPLGETPVGETP